MTPRFLVFLLLLPLVTTSLAGSSPIAPGQWKTTISMLMPGMPFNPAPRSFINCISHEQTQAPLESLAHDTIGPECTLSDFSYSDGKGHWRSSCKGDRASEAETWLSIIDRNHYAIRTEMALLDTGGGVITISSQSQRLGDCQSVGG